MACKNCPEKKKYSKINKTEIDILLNRFIEKKLTKTEMKQKVENYIIETIIALCPNHKNCCFIKYLNEKKF